MRAFSILLIMLSIESCITNNGSSTMRAERFSDEATILLKGKVENVFPLFGPIREKEWAHGWNPEIVFSTSGIVEEQMIFKSPSRFENEPPYLWIVTKYFPEQYLIEYTVTAPERIWLIRVRCSAQDDLTSATISYSFTGLTPRGNQRNKIALEQMYSNRLKDWEEAINHYLNTGTILTPQ